MRLIDADTLKNYLNVEFIFDNRDRHRVRDLIDIQPTIKVEPVRRGWWEFTTNAFAYKDGSRYPGYKCSECDNRVWHGGNYCPNCGAKMEE